MANAKWRTLHAHEEIGKSEIGKYEKTAKEERRYYSRVCAVGQIVASHNQSQETCKTRSAKAAGRAQLKKDWKLLFFS